MKKRALSMAGLLVTLLLMPMSSAAELIPVAEPNHEIHNALRGLRDRLLDATNKKDIDGILAEMHPNVVVTWQNAEVSHGKQAVRRECKVRLLF